MTTANIHRRHSLEEAYSADAFASDAVQNSRPSAEVFKGVRILSAPDAVGDFAFERATQQIGEAVSAAFLAPYRLEDRQTNGERGSPTTEAADPDPRGEYEAFLADIVAAAQRVGFNPEETPRPDDPRLRGLRQ